MLYNNCTILSNFKLYVCLAVEGQKKPNIICNHFCIIMYYRWQLFAKIWYVIKSFALGMCGK